MNWEFWIWNIVWDTEQDAFGAPPDCGEGTADRALPHRLECTLHIGDVIWSQISLKSPALFFRGSAAVFVAPRRDKAATGTRHQKRLIYSEECFLHLSFCGGCYHKRLKGWDDRLDAEMMQWSFTSCRCSLLIEILSEAKQSWCYLRYRKREGYSKPKKQSNKIASSNFLHPTKQYLFWRGSWVSWKGCGYGNAVRFPSGNQHFHQLNAALLLPSAVPSRFSSAALSLASALPFMCTYGRWERKSSQSQDSVQNTSVEWKREVWGVFFLLRLSVFAVEMTEVFSNCIPAVPSQMNFKHFIISRRRISSKEDDWW